MSAAKQVVLVYGGCGALGASLIDFFNAKAMTTISVDFNASAKATHSLTLTPSATLTETCSGLVAQVGDLIRPTSGKLAAVLNAAGGWAGGNILDDKICQVAETMWAQSCGSSIVAGVLAGKFLADLGLVALIGAKPAVDGTPGMIGYGMAKAAVIQLTKSLALPDSGLPKSAKVVCILPVTLDTPNNRKWMASADFTTWTKCDTIAQKYFDWMTGKDALVSGSLVSVVTQNDKTAFTAL